MVTYTCMDCSKNVGDEFIRKRVRCPYCGGKMLYKTTDQPRVIKSV